MAKAINDGVEVPLKEPQVWWFDHDSDAFFQSLEDKQQAALLLSSELAAWFGDLSIPASRV
jgi:hypothetical protein